MTVLTESDVGEATIVTEVGEIPFAEIQFEEGTTIAEEDTITIEDEYTSASSTTTTDIFIGPIEDIDYFDETNAYALSMAVELESLIPSDYTYTGTLVNLLIELINLLCSNVSLPDDGDCIGKFAGEFNTNSDTDGIAPTNWTVTLGSPTVESDELDGHIYYIKTTSVSVDALYRTFTAQEYGTVEFFIATSDLLSTMNFFIYDNISYCIKINIFQDNIQVYHAATYTNYQIEANKWYHIRVDFECGASGYKGLSPDRQTVYINGEEIISNVAFHQNNTADNFTRIYFLGDIGQGNGYVDSIDLSWSDNYVIGRNNNYQQTYLKYQQLPEYPVQEWIFDDDKILKTILDEYAEGVYAGWYLTNDLKIYCNDLNTDSGFNLALASECYDITGNKQIKKIDKVILLGGFVSGTRLIVTSGTGENIFKDTYAHITVESILQEIADNILSKKELAPVEIILSFINPTIGMLQVGETVSVAADIIFDDSTKTIPAGQYIIMKSEFNTLTKESKLYLSDGMIFKRELSPSEENSQLIKQTIDIAINNETNISTLETDISTLETDLATHEGLTTTAHGGITNMVYDDDDGASNDNENVGWTKDASWHEMDWDTYKTVPSGVKGAYFKVVYKSNAVGHTISFRSTTQSNAFQIAWHITVVANVYHSATCFIPLDSDHKFDYLISNSNIELRMTVLWWVY